MAEKTAHSQATRRRRWLQLGSGSIAWLISLIILAAAAHRADQRWDLTPHGQFTLQPGLITIVDQLAAEPDVSYDIFGLWPQPSRAGAWQPLLERLEAQLDQIAATSANLNYRRIDYQFDKPTWDDFQTTHPYTQPNNVYLHRPGRPLYRIALHGGLLPRLQQEIGGGLVSLVNPNPPRCYVVDINAGLRTSGDDNGSELAWQALRRGGFDVARVDLAAVSASQRLPSDGVVIIPGPTNAWPEVARQALVDYLEAGHHVLFMADDRLPSDLQAVLRRYGILLALASGPDEPAAVAQHLDLRLRAGDMRFDRLLLGAEDGINPALDMTQSIISSGRQILWPRSIPTWVIADPEQASQVLGPGPHRLPTDEPVDVIGLPPAGSWLAPFGDSQPRLKNNDEAPAAMPLVRLLQYDHEQSEQRIVLWGSLEALSNRHLQQEQFGNAELLVQVTSWLAQRQAPVGIIPQQLAPYTLNGDDSQLHWVLLLLVAIFPACSVGVAILVWWERR